MFFFRQAQIIYSNRKSTVEEIDNAIESLKKAMELKKNEKIYEHNKNFLKSFNLDNHDTIF